MTASPSDPTPSPSPGPSHDPELRTAAETLAPQSLVELFANDPQRAERYRIEAAGMHYSYAKQRVDDGALDALLGFARRCDLEGRIAALFAGEMVNPTEGRAALHMALRAPAGQRWQALDEPVDKEVHATRERFLDFAEALRSGQAAAADGGAITDVVNIGIGGSDLGPRMVCEALAPLADGPRTHFIANVDAAEREAALARCDPARTPAADAAFSRSDSVPPSTPAALSGSRPPSGSDMQLPIAEAGRRRVLPTTVADGGRAGARSSQAVCRLVTGHPSVVVSPRIAENRR